MGATRVIQDRQHLTLWVTCRITGLGVKMYRRSPDHGNRNSAKRELALKPTLEQTIWCFLSFWLGNPIVQATEEKMSA